MPRESDLRHFAPDWMVTLGVRAWLAVGVFAVVAVVGSMLGTAAGLVLPLVIAFVLAALFEPVVGMLERRKLPRAAGASLVILVLLAAAVGTAWVVVAGVLSQRDAILSELQKGIAALLREAEALSIPVPTSDEITMGADELVRSSLSGTLGAFSTGLSGLGAFAFGSFLGMFILYYVLTDFDRITTWLGSHLGVAPSVGEDVVNDAVRSLRQYFKSQTVSGLIVAVFIGAAMYFMDLPLILAIIVVTWLTGYIPFVGPIIAGGFATIIALGSGGPSQALLVLVVILVAQNIVQMIVSNYLISESLALHPLSTLIATILGGTFAGLLGATLGAPVLAIFLGSRDRLRAQLDDPEQASGAPDPAASG